MTENQWITRKVRKTHATRLESSANICPAYHIIHLCFGAAPSTQPPPTRLFYSKTKLADPWNRLWSCQVTSCTASMPCVSHYWPFLHNHSSHHLCYLVPPPHAPVFSSLCRHCNSQSFVVTTDNMTCENGCFRADPPTRLLCPKTKLADPWHRLWSYQVKFCTAYMPCVSHYWPFLRNHSSHHMCYLVLPLHAPVFVFTI